MNAVEIEEAISALAEQKGRHGSGVVGGGNFLDDVIAQR